MRAVEAGPARAHADRQGLSRRPQPHPRRGHVRARDPRRHRARRHRAGRRRRRRARLRSSRGIDRTQRRARGGHPGRLSRDRSRHDGQPVLLFGLASDLDRGAAHRRRRGAGDGRGRRRVDLPGSKQPQHERSRESLDERAQARDLHADGADGGGCGEAVQGAARDAGRVLAAVAAAHGGRAEGRQDRTKKSRRST